MKKEDRQDLLIICFGVVAAASIWFAKIVEMMP